jgi:hypothetical protein
LEIGLYARVSAPTVADRVSSIPPLTGDSAENSPTVSGKVCRHADQSTGPVTPSYFEGERLPAIRRLVRACWTFEGRGLICVLSRVVVEVELLRKFVLLRNMMNFSAYK